MRKAWIALLFLSFTVWAANIKLYLKDGGYHLVREYQVQTDRVHFYSVEREEWEDIPLDMVDLKKTDTEAAARKATIDHDTKVLDDEAALERSIKKETLRIPENPGVYWLQGDQTKPLKLAEGAVHSDKKREILKALSPIPAISGRATLEIEGAHAQNVFTNPEQEFYIQLSETERFGICKVTTKGAIRIVENLTYMPVTKEVEEDPVMVDIFRQQLTPDGLYKIWPKEKMAPGEYAVIEYTAGKVNIQIWDFAVK
ncbi:MAG TPA: hypothetical protein VG456_00920 [Candidatus Sulfopaludibacter sp.]|jgi:hypothetical protein|nr:hypothetical protein [Candidatus Sulfopaludibacter sp.]